MRRWTAEKGQREKGEGWKVHEGRRGEESEFVSLWFFYSDNVGLSGKNSFWIRRAIVKVQFSLLHASGSNFTQNSANFGAIVYHVYENETANAVTNFSFTNSNFLDNHATHKGVLIFSDFVESDRSNWLPEATIPMLAEYFRVLPPENYSTTTKTVRAPHDLPQLIALHLWGPWRVRKYQRPNLVSSGHHFWKITKSGWFMNGSFDVTSEPSELFFHTTSKKIVLSLQNENYRETAIYFLDSDSISSR